MSSNGQVGKLEEDDVSRDSALDEKSDTGSEKTKTGTGDSTVDTQVENAASSDEKEDEDENEEGDDVPEGGYGWFVVLGCFLSHILVGGVESAEGLIFIHFTERFGENAQLTAAPGALLAAIRLFTGPIAAAICNRYSVRTCVMIGAAIFSVSQILDGLAPNFYFLFFSHAALQGVGRGLLYAPSIIIVRQYFHKRQSLATGIGTSGLGVGTFLVVPLINELFSTYGYQGSFLILGGLALHGFVFAFLYRPLSLHRKFNGQTRKSRKGDQQHNDTDKGEDSLPLTTTKSGAEYYEVGRQLNNTEDSNIATTESNANGNSSHGARRRTQNGCLKSSLQICFPVEHQQGDNKGQGLRNLFHFGLLRVVPFLLYCLSMVLFNNSSKAAFTFLPSLIVAKGLDDSDAALSLMIIGAFDTVGRVAVGFLLNISCLQPIRPLLYNSMLFMIAGSSIIIPFMAGDRVLLFIVSGIFGLLTGGYISQKSVVLVDILGKGNMASAFGLLLAFQGIGTAVGPPLSGALKDGLGDFDEIFYLSGASMTGAGLLMVASNISRRLRVKSGKHHKTEVA